MKRRNFIAGLLATPVVVFASKFMPKAKEPVVYWEGTRIPRSVMRTEIGTISPAAFAEVAALEKRIQELTGVTCSYAYFNSTTGKMTPVGPFPIDTRSES